MDDFQVDFSAVDPKAGFQVDFSPLTSEPKARAFDGLTGNPDQAGKAISLGQQAGVPSTVVNMDPKPIDEQVKRQEISDLIDKHPGLGQYIMGDPMAAYASADDWKTLGKIAEAGKNLVTDWTSRGWESAEMGTYGFYKMAGSEAYDDRIKKIQSDLDASADRDGFVAGMGDMFGGIAYAMTHGGPKGAAVGATIGAVSGPGAAITASGGFTAGTLGDMAQSWAGNSYLKARQTEGLAGNKLSEGAARAVGVFAGSIGMTAAIFSGVKGGQIAAEAATRLGVALLGKDAVVSGIGRAATSLINSLGNGAAFNVASFLTETVGTDLAKNVSAGPFNTLENSPEEREKFVSGLVSTALEGAAQFGALHAVGMMPPGLNPVMDKLHMDVVTEHQRRAQELFDLAQESTTRQRAPELFQQFMRKAIGADVVRLDANALAELVRQNPNAFEYVPTRDRMIADAAKNGGDVSIPVEDFYTKTTPDDFAAIKDHMRADNGMTPAEAVELQQHWIDVFHGSGADFDKFHNDFIGSGEGHQAYGMGHYVAENPDVAGDYHRKYSKTQEFIGGEARDPANVEHTAQVMASRILQETDPAMIEARRSELNSNTFSADEHTRNAANRAFDFLDNPAEAKTVETRRTGALYTAKIGRHPEEFLNLDKPLAEQPKMVEKLKAAGFTFVTDDPKADPTKQQPMPGIYHEGKVIAYGDPLQMTGHQVFDGFRQANEPGEALTYKGKTYEHIDDLAEATETVQDGIATTHVFMSGLPRAQKIAKLIDINERQLADQKKWFEEEWPREKIEYQDKVKRAEADLARVKNDPNSNSEDIREYERYVEIDRQQLENIKESYDSYTEHLEAQLDVLKNHPDTIAEVQRVPNGGREDWNQHFSNILHEQGIAGHEYWDGFSRTRADGTKNYVVYDPADITITHKNGVEIPREAKVRVLEDRIETSSEGTRKALWLDPLTKHTLNMTAPEFAQYSKHLQALQQALTQKAFDAAYREINRREGKLWKADTETMRGEVEKDFADRGDFHAEDVFGKKDSLLDKLDPAAINEMFSLADLDRLGVREDGPAKAIYELTGGKDSVHPDDVAGFFGFDSGKEMIESLIKLAKDREDRGETMAKQRDRLTNEETARRMEEKHGKLDQKILDAAIESAMEVKQIDVFVDEIKAIARDAGIDELQLTKDDIQKAAGDHLDRRPAKEGANVNRALQAVARFGRQAELALLRKDYAAAFQAKQRQAVQFEVARQAKTFAREYAATNKLIEQYKDNRTLDRVDQDYTDRIHEILNAIDVDMPRSEDNLERAGGGRTVEDFIYDKRAQGLVIDDSLIRSSLKDGQDIWRMKDMSVARFRELSATLKSLDAVGRDVQTITIKGKQEFLNDVLEDIFKRTDWRPEKGDQKEITKILVSLKNGLLRPEGMLDRLDNHDVLGPLNTHLFRPLRAAEYAHIDFRKEFTEAIKTVQDKKWAKQLTEVLENKTLMKANGQPMKLTRQNLVTMMLNMGSDGNFRVLTEGYGWHPEDTEEFVRKHATEKDWQQVKKIWDFYDKHVWPKVEDVTKELTGVAVERVKGRKIDTEFGPMEGGYFPLLADRDSAKFKFEGDATDWHLMQPFVRASSFKDRTGAVYPVNLTLDAMGGHLAETAHALAYAVPIKEARKILYDPLFQEQITDKMGKSTMAQLDGWFKATAQGGENYTNAAVKDYMKLGKELRTNAVTTLIWLRGGTALLHGLSALSTSVGEVGVTPFAREAAFNMWTKDPVTQLTWYKFALEHSKELQQRRHNLDPDLTYAMDNFQGGTFNNARKVWAKVGSSVISGFDFASTLPTWLAAYREGIKTMDHDDAVYLADKTVRNAHGSNSVVDMSAVQRAPMLKPFTMFYGYFNHNFNQVYDMGSRVKEGYNFWRDGDSPEAAKAFSEVLRKFAFYLVIPGLIHQLIRGKDEGEDSSTLGRLAWATAEQGFNGIPFVRDAVSAWEYGVHAGATPMVKVVDSFVDAARDAYRYKEDGEIPDHWFKHLAVIPGYAFGIGAESLAGWGDGAINMDQLDEVSWKRFILDANPKPRK